MIAPIKHRLFHVYSFRCLGFLALCVFAALPLQAQLQKTNPTLSYEHKGLKVNLTESESQFVVAFEKNFDYSNIVKKYDLKCVYRPLADSALYHVHMAAKPIVFMGDTKKIKNLDFENVSDLANALRKQEGVLAAYPMVLAEDGTPQAYTNKVIIKVKQAFDNRNTQLILNDLGVQPDSWQPLLVPNSYAVVTQKNISAIDLTKRLEKNAFIEYAEPDFVLFLKKLNDPLYPNQWSLNNLGAASHPNGIPDADIDAPEAWTITKGNSNIKVAVLDEGVELNHPDLAANMLPGFDATGLGSAGQCNSGDSHGTACAGIIAAVDSNGIGIKGIAPRCKIVPVRIAYAGLYGGWVTDDNTIANAIIWAYTTGNADILSNSWGGGSPSNLITNAIENAVSLGRNGLGSVVLFASGNNNFPALIYPAVLPSVISVASTSMCNERKSESSCDGESWGANYGDDLDIAAPGVKINTTDNIGSGGYNPNGDYYATFNGTSSACPHAAGVMALILSVNSSLTATQARRIIEKSCDKVGGYAYQNLSNQPHGTWSFDLGYGKVNAYKALKLIQNNLYVSFATPQQLFASPTASVPFTNLSENAVSYQWFFPGGTPSTSTAFQPTVTYQGLGSYNVTLIATSASGVKDTLHIPNYIKLSNQLLMQNGIVSTCNAVFYDEGGANGNYSNNSNQVLTIHPAIAGNKVRVQFSSFNVKSPDYLYVYDGPNLDSPLIGYYSGTNFSQIVTATNIAGALTFRFVSNDSTTASGWVAQISCYEPTPMVFQNMTTFQSTSATVRIGSSSNHILRIDVNTSGELNPLNITQFNFSANGSTNAQYDISRAHLYYSGKDINPFFSYNYLGTASINPNGTFSINGNQTLQKGTNYFWLVYDIDTNATEDNVVDAQLLSAVVSGADRTPIDGNPVGSRRIVKQSVSNSQFFMHDGNITTCDAGFYDTGGENSDYLNNNNLVLTINPTSAGNKVRIRFSYIDLAPSDSLYMYDGTNTNAPLIGVYSGYSLGLTITATNISGALTVKFTSNGSITSRGWVAKISCHRPVPMVVQSINSIHPTTTAVGVGANDSQMLRITVNTNGDANPLNITQLNLSTNGSTNALADISGARLYYTDSLGLFSTNNSFGTVVANPNGTFSVSGNKVLHTGLNYFWLVYDIKSSAVVGNVVDVQLLSVVIGDTTRTPANGNPVGSRIITNQILMQSGSITACNAVFYDEGGENNNYSNNSNKILTINPAISGSKVRMLFSVFNLESNYDFLQIYDGTSINAPLIGTYTGNTLFPAITATNASGALTLRFTSNSFTKDIGWVAQISCYQPVPMVFQSIAVNHPTMSNVGVGSSNNRIFRITIDARGEINPLNVTRFNLNTNGSSNASTDISEARLYYTGGDGLFSTNSSFGTAVTNLNGTFSISGNQTLQAGLNNFWLVYDIKNDAVAGNVVDAQLLSVIVENTTRTPINGNPAGSRTITHQVLMQNGSVTTCNATFYDEGGIDGNYLNNSNKVLTINPAVSGSKLHIRFTSFSLDAYSDLLYIYDGTSINSPLIGSYSNASFPPTIAATNAAGALTFRFVSNDTIVYRGWVAQISCLDSSPMVFQSIAVTHPTQATVDIGSNNNQILRIAVNTTGESNPLIVTQFNLSNSGSTNAANDISSAYLYYTYVTGNTQYNAFFGAASINPDGTLRITGGQTLQRGINNFWLYYSISDSATGGNVVDAQLLSMVVGGTTITPAEGNPLGSRTIASQVPMQNSSITTCSATFYDDGGVSTNYLNNSNRVMTVHPAVLGNRARVQFSYFFLEPNADFLYVYDGTDINSPLIGTYSGFTLPPAITATNVAGALTFRFVSNDTIAYWGWAAQISCCPVIPKPTITVLGDTNLCDGSSVLLTASGGNNYLWSNGATSQSISVGTGGNYSVRAVVGNCTSEPSPTVKLNDLSGFFRNILVSAAPDTVVSVGENVTLSSIANNGQVKITEITLSRSGTGASSTYPSWIPPEAGRFIEITNVGAGTLNLSANTLLQIYSENAVLLSYPLPNISLNVGQVLVIHLGAGTDNPAQKYFNTGILTNTLTSGSSVGFVLRNKSNQQIIDAVTTNNYVFPAASGVASAEWSGSIANLYGFAGASLQELDNNRASSWVRSSTTNPQSIGNTNPNLGLNNLNFNWTGSNGFTATGSVVNTGALNTKGIHTFTASLSVGNCIFSKSVNIYVGVPAPQEDIQVFPNPSAGDFTLLGKGIQHIELFDVQGRIVYKETIQQPTSNSTAVQLRGVAQDVYFLKIFTTNSVVTKRLIIQ